MYVHTYKRFVYNKRHIADRVAAVFSWHGWPVNTQVFWCGCGAAMLRLYVWEQPEINFESYYVKLNLDYDYNFLIDLAHNGKKNIKSIVEIFYNRDLG